MKRFLKPLLLLLWLGVVGYAIYTFERLGIPLSEYPQRIKEYLDGAGVWAPVIYVVLYAIRPIIFFPASLLTILGGLLFGPFWGTIYTVVGSNLSASVAFGIGRYFGKSLLDELSNKFIQKLNNRAEESGFMTVLILRLIYVPFDLVNYGCGVSQIRYRDYVLASFLGMLSGTLTFVLLGGAAGSAVGIEGGEDPMNQTLISLGLSAFFFAGGLILSKYLSKRNRDLAALKES